MADVKNKGHSPIIPPKSLPSNAEAHVVVAHRLSRKILALQQLNLNFIYEEPSPLDCKLFLRTINNIRSCLKTYLQNRKKELYSSSHPIIKNNPEEFEEQLKPMLLKIMRESQEQNEMWRKEFQKMSDKWKMVIEERDLEIESLQENLKSKDQILNALQERCAIRIGRNPITETKPREGSHVKQNEQSGDKSIEDLKLIKPAKKNNLKVRKKEG